ncbi:MAG: hypothetical protein ACP5UQ_02960 [Anaerolineae bacterium]
MQDDERYCAMQLAIAAEFATFDRETWKAAEADAQASRVTLDV